MNVEALTLASIFFLSPFSPSTSAAIRKEASYAVQVVKATAKLSGFVLKGTLLGWNRLRWMDEAAGLMNHEELSTMDHEVRTMHMMDQFGDYLDWHSHSIQQGIMSAVVHDIGKLFIPKSIVNAPRKLTEHEFRIMRRHVVWSGRVMHWIPGFWNIAGIVASHHENWDGSGYPKGRKEYDIYEIARALAIVDTYDAMAEDRPYRKSMRRGLIFKELRRVAGTQFDPYLVDRFIEFMNDDKPTQKRDVPPSNLPPNNDALRRAA